MMSNNTYFKLIGAVGFVGMAMMMMVFLFLNHQGNRDVRYTSRSETCVQFEGGGVAYWYPADSNAWFPCGY